MELDSSPGITKSLQQAANEFRRGLDRIARAAEPVAMAMKQAGDALKNVPAPGIEARLNYTTSINSLFADQPDEVWAWFASTQLELPANHAGASAHVIWNWWRKGRTADHWANWRTMRQDWQQGARFHYSPWSPAILGGKKVQFLDDLPEIVFTVAEMTTARIDDDTALMAMGFDAEEREFLKLYTLYRYTIGETAEALNLDPIAADTIRRRCDRRVQLILEDAERLDRVRSALTPVADYPPIYRKPHTPKSKDPTRWTPHPEKSRHGGGGSVRTLWTP